MELSPQLFLTLQRRTLQVLLWLMLSVHLVLETVNKSKADLQSKDKKT
jgi:hypothetical protein